MIRIKPMAQFLLNIFLLSSLSLSAGASGRSSSDMHVNPHKFIKMYPDFEVDSRFYEPRPDWAFNLKPLDDELVSSIRKLIRDYGYTTRSQPNKTKYSGWEIMPMIQLLNNSFLLTKDIRYLEETRRLYLYFRSVRMDKKNRINYEGLLLPQWERIDRYNIFHVSPYKKYSPTNKEQVIRSREWKSLYFSDVNYSGLILDQFLRFAQIIEKNKIQGFDQIVKLIIHDSILNFKSHEKEWIKTSNLEGHYIFPKNSPFYLDGVEMPVNEAAIYGSFLVRLGLLTKDNSYLERAKNIYNHWKKHFIIDESGYINYPYVLGSWHSGWTEINSPSINSPRSQKTNGPEVFHKAGLTIDFLLLLNSSTGLAKKELNAFQRTMDAILETRDRPLTGEFPNYLGFYYPRDTAHFNSKYYQGWIKLMHDNNSYNRSLERSYQAGFTRLSYYTLGLLYNHKKHPHKASKKEITFSPEYIGKDTKGCDFISKKNYLGSVNFQHTSPKNNKLFLYSTNAKNNRVRLRINTKTNKFKGKIFIPKNTCLKLLWSTDKKHGFPLNASENIITIDAYH